MGEHDGNGVRYRVGGGERRAPELVDLRNEGATRHRSPPRGA